jgi:N6-adenosine-specific RNA methylase IME4
MTSAPWQVMPPLSADEYQALKADIALRGVMVPVEYDQDGAVIDGRHRVRACQELGPTDWPRIARTYESEADRRLQARRLNLDRRHLSQESRRALIADELRDDPTRSNRQIAAELGVSHVTVGEIRNSLQATGQIDQLDRTVGADGKARPTTPARRPAIASLHLPEVKPDQVTSFTPRDLAAASTAYRAAQIQARRAERVHKLAALAQGNSELPAEQRFPIIYADPPWRYEHPTMSESRAVENHYPTMPLEEICGLGVGDLATPDALLFLWVPAPILEQGFAVIRAWGFAYRTGLVWIKDRIGMGNYVRAQHEHLLIARRGEPPLPAPAARPSSVLHAPRTEHSAKPAEAYELIERLYPELPRIELFARNRREGWSAWGNQAGPSEPENEPKMVAALAGDGA